VWIADVTAAALFSFDEYDLHPSSHLLVPRGRNISRIGHVVHTSLDIPLIDRTEIFGLPVTSPTRTIVDLARTQSVERLTLAVDSATRDRLTSDDFLHRRLVALSGRGRPGALATARCSPRHRGHQGRSLVARASLPRALPHRTAAAASHPSTSPAAAATA
jgi:hypothetical protein